MPAIIGPVQIISVSGGVAHFGDAAWVSPKSNSKTYSGSGGFNTGGFIITNNAISGTNILDADLIDQPTAFNK